MLHFKRQATCSKHEIPAFSKRPTTCSFCCAKILNWTQSNCVQGVGCVTCHGLIQHQLHLPQLRYHCISLSPDGSRRPLICHLNGVRFLTPEQREALGTTAGSGGGEVSGDGSLAKNPQTVLDSSVNTWAFALLRISSGPSSDLAWGETVGSMVPQRSTKAPPKLRQSCGQVEFYPSRTMTSRKDRKAGRRGEAGGRVLSVL